MSKIDELLKGEKVEWKKLGDVCEIKRGRVISKAYLEQNSGDFPVYSSQTRNNGEIGKINTYDFDGEYATWTTDGAYAGTVFYRNGKFSITNICGLIKPNDSKKLLVKFIVYWLQIEAIKHVKGGSGNPKLMSNVVAKIKIPIPSIETQEKIVEILDKFTECVTELQAELQARVKQYEYYRDELLSEDYLNKLTNGVCNFDSKVHELKSFELDELVKIRNGKDWKNLEKGNIPVYGSGGNMNIYVNKYSYDKPTVLIPRKGSIENVFYLEEPFWNVDTIFYTEIDENKIIPKYFYYFIEGFDISKLCTSSTRPSLTQSVLNKVKIDLPPLEIQSKVVEILDKFQSLVSESQGLLPQEIEQRQKQYEFYREKLLTFNDKVVTHTHTHTQLISSSYFDTLKEASEFVGVNLYKQLEYKKLSELAKVTKLAGYEFTKYVKYKDEGKIIALRGLNVKKGKIFLDNVKYIDGSDFSKLERSKLIKDDILFTYVGTIGEVGLVCEEDKFYLAPNVAMIRVEKDTIIPKFLLYLLQSSTFRHKEINKWLESSSMKNLTMENIRKFNIIVPSIAVQNYIVKILDKLDTYANDINEGLPKEIELRQKQYEYYREKLLDFPR